MLTLRTLHRLELVDGEPPSARAIAAQPKRLALLAYLAVAQPRGFHNRDTLLALFWPDLSDAEARRALRQALYQLRETLGHEAILSRGDDSIALADGALRCDAVELEAAIEVSDFERVAALYDGDFMAGVHISDTAPEFEDWLSATRLRLRGHAARVAWSRSDAHDRAGQRDQAVGAARWAVNLAPDDEDAVRRLMTLLERNGERAGAMQLYREFSARLAREFGTAPAAETRDLLSTFTPAEIALPERDAGAAVAEPVRARRPHAHRRLVAIVAAAVIVGATGGLVVWTRTTAQLPIFAVGSVTVPSGSDTLPEARALSELLATNLSRIPELRVVARGRVFELLEHVGRPPDTPGSMSAAMRRAGAHEAIEGVLYYGAGAQLRLDLRRIDLATGLVQQAYTVRADNAFTLADRATEAVAASLRVRPPASPVASVTSASLLAVGFYDEGMRAASLGDRAGSERLFRAAVREDSTFAMASYALGLSLPPTTAFRHERIALLRRAVALSETAADRDRLAIRYGWALVSSDTRRARVYADSLARRFPDDPESHLAAGNMIMLESQDEPTAIAHFRKAMELDSLSFRHSAGRCLACEGVSALIGTYFGMDSVAAAERWARWWLTRQPESAKALWTLSSVLRIQGRYDESEAAIGRAARTQPGSVDPLFEAIFTAIFRERYAEAEQLLAARARGLSGEGLQDNRWWQIISLRNQGRLGEAIALVRVFDRNIRSGIGNADSVAGGQVLFEAGLHRESAARFLDLAESYGRYEGQFPAFVARYRAWFRTHAATALAAAGDTTALLELADSIEVAGALSGTARDTRLHHYARGLIWKARGRDDSAAASFQRALTTPVYGYTRINLELARALVRQGRPREAATLLAAGLHGPIETNNYYVTRTELREALAQALDSAGAHDSARVQYELVARSWGAGDSPFRARAELARRRAMQLRS